jgi:hypothetical protein
MGRAIARFWTRPDGATCLLHKREDGWWLTIQRDDEIIKELSLPSPRDALKIAKEWREPRHKPAESA